MLEPKWLSIVGMRHSCIPVSAILAWSPFGKRFNGLTVLQSLPWGLGIPKGVLSGLGKFEGPDPVEFVPRGFAIINVDARSSGDSDGTVGIMGTQEAEDGYDVIEAVAKMPWCNGNVGLAGNPHLAIIQWFIAALQPPSLKTIAPWEDVVICTASNSLEAGSLMPVCLTLSSTITSKGTAASTSTRFIAVSLGQLLVLEG
ncbi:hypothetical protein BBP40_002557 [Aspergillus hancockii]|nr:hypothetical protein BBP40_002557 [Aspergillus hancockii]